ncbi:hypothetical protein AB0O87_11395 [Microbacterium sp. NPDC076768]|uniref:hypothetical protein n=1 Tax=Microbacterium sp. NPDC076768 TaxID=3154858 RepID=UPI00344960FF
MNQVTDPRFVLNRITASEWVINDLRYASNDPRHVVACVYELAETEVEVTWLRDLPLATRYGTAFDVLADLERMDGAHPSTRPVTISENPPLLTT